MTASPEEIRQDIADECDALRQFVALLEQEQQTLLAPDTDQLLELAARKTQMAEDLLARVRHRQTRLPAGTAATESWLKKHVPGALNAWHELIDLAAFAQRLNQTSGELIRVRLRYNQQALHALIGASQQAAGVYGPDGQPSLGSGKRTLGNV